MPQEHELRLNIDASAAKRGKAEFVAAITAVKQAVSQLDRDTTGAFTQLRRGATINLDARPVANTSKELVQLDRNVKRWATSTKSASLSAAAALRTSENEAQRLAARLDRLGDAGAIRTLDRELARLKGTLATASKPIDVRSARSGFSDVSADLKRRAVDLETVARSEREAASAANLHAAALDSLRSKYNPLYAASKQYEAALEEIASAERAGVITSQLATDARQRASLALTQSNTTLDAYAKTSRMSGLATSNLAAQFNDIGVMLAAGQSPFILAIQQGTQVSQVLNQMGGDVRTVGNTLRAAFLSVVSPVSLLTIGTIAAGAALGQWALSAFNAGSETANLEDRMRALKALSDGLTASIDILDMSVAELTETYGSAAIQVREFALLQAQLRLAEANSALSSQSSILRDAAGAYYTLTDAGRTYRVVLDRIARDFGVTTRQARGLESALQAAATASTFDEQVSALSDLRRLLQESGIAASDLPPELAAALSEMIDLTNETQAARKLADDLAAATSEIAPSITPAIDQAAALKAELAAALALLNRINNQEDKTYSGRGQDPRDFMPGGSKADYEKSLDYVSVDELIERYTPKTSGGRSSSGRSGGGSRGRSAALSDEARELERVTSSIEDRLTSLQDERRALDLVASGNFETTEAARLYAEAQRLGIDVTDAKTASMLRQIDALAALKERSQQTDPMTQVREAFGQGIEDGLTDALSGKFDASKIVDQLRQSVARTLSQDLLSKFAPGLQTGLQGGVTRGSQQGAQMMRTAIVTAGQQHAQMIGAAMRGSALQTVPGTAPKVGSGGFLSSIFGSVAGFFGLPVGAYAEGGLTGQAVTTLNASPALFRNAPHYAEGTPNTSGGTPAILHPNEAVIPLSRGRKVPVDLGNATASGSSVTMGNVIVQVPPAAGRETDEKQAQRIGDAVQERLGAMMDARLAEAQRYGSPFNRRGG